MQQKPWQARLKLFIDASEKTQETIALDAGISPGALSNLVTGRRSATIEYLQQICDALEIPLSELFLSDDIGMYKRLQTLQHQLLALRTVDEQELDVIKRELAQLILDANTNHKTELRSLLPLVKRLLS